MKVTGERVHCDIMSDTWVETSPHYIFGIHARNVSFSWALPYFRLSCIVNQDKRPSHQVMSTRFQNILLLRRCNLPLLYPGTALRRTERTWRILSVLLIYPLPTSITIKHNIFICKINRTAWVWILFLIYHLLALWLGKLFNFSESWFNCIWKKDHGSTYLKVGYRMKW